MNKILAVVTAAVFVVAGCSGPNQAAKTAAGGAPPPPVAAKTAGQIVQAMRPKIPQIRAITIWTAESDPNMLLGRPSQYTSSASMADKRIDPTETGVDAGATVEVFATVEDAQRRADYIAAIKQGGAMGTEYHTLSGTVLLRVIGTLTPSANEAYAAAFAASLR